MLLFTSGAGALALEVAWYRRMAQVAGGTSLALAAVLAGVLGGMALGAHLVGRFADRVRKPLDLYARLETGVALAALLSPLLLDGARTLHAGLPNDGLRFLLSVALLLPPSLFLGGSLPAAAAALRDPAAQLGRLYAANTLGAVAGTLLAGFLLLPSFGLAWTMRISALFSGSAAFFAFRWAEPVEPRETRPLPQAPRAILLYAISGFLGLFCEVTFTRSLVLVFGSSTYAFSTMLAVFLAGIGLGGALATRFTRDALRRLEWTVGLTAALLSLSALSIHLLPRLYLRGHAWLGGSLLLPFLLSCLALLPGCIGLGAAFTLAARLAGTSASGTGRLYAWNTLASIAGSTLAVFAAIPWLGPQRATAAAATAAALAAGLRRPALLGCAAVAALGFLPPPAAARERLYAGVYHNPSAWMRDGAIDEEAWADGADLRGLFFGREMTVSLLRWYGPLSLLVDGKAEASEQSGSDLQHLALLGHVPMALHEDPQSVLVVGLGLGKTYEACRLHAPRSLRVVEIEPAVVEALRSIGREPEGVTIADARLFLRGTRETYDVISSDPIHPWVRGSGDLYTREYFESCRERLNPGGVACQWLPLYQMSLEDVKSVVRTFASVFRCAAFFGGTDLILVGGAIPKARALPPPVVDALRGIGVDDLDALRVAGHETLVRAAGEGPLLTDDSLRLEFSTPSQLDNRDLPRCLEWVLSLWPAPPPPFGALLRAQVAWARGDGAAWSREIDAAAREAPENAFRKRYTADMYLLAGGRKFLEAARRLRPEDPRLLGVEADLLAREGDRAGAAALYRRILAGDPENAFVRRRLARVE